jgi:hypothetical protein
MWLCCCYFQSVLNIRWLSHTLPFNPHGYHCFEHILHNKGLEVEVNLPVNRLTLLKYSPSEWALGGGDPTLLELEGHELGLVGFIDEDKQKHMCGVVVGFQRERDLVGVTLIEVGGQGEASASGPDIRGLVGV